MQTIIVTDETKQWSFLKNEVTIISPEEYLSKDKYHEAKSIRVINLCRSYDYQKIGYYVSLLAQARDHKTFPSVHSIQDVTNVSLSKFISQNTHHDIQQCLRKIKGDEFVLSLYFGQNLAQRYSSLCKQLHGLFPLPLLRVSFERKKSEWRIKSLKIISLTDIPSSHFDFLHEAARQYLNRKRVHQPRKKQKYHDLAILVEPTEKNAPSNKKALDFFVASGEEIGLNVDLVDRNESKAIAEYDALFIRVTTSVNHYTYRVARRAAQENLVVIDDPLSIIKCTNKVYLAELLSSHQIPTPKTTFISKFDQTLPPIEFPCVIKKPDSAFSHGVIKVDDEQMLKKTLKEFFKSSELVIIQHFIPTEFDWRIGILDNKPLFACRYYMAEGHWQIYDWQAPPGKAEGQFETIPVHLVPDPIIKTALKSARLIGDGLYGVDLKSHNNQHYVIEINDNPNIDNGVEDYILGETLYQQIMNVFLQRIRRKHGYV